MAEAFLIGQGFHHSIYMTTTFITVKIYYLYRMTMVYHLYIVLYYNRTSLMTMILFTKKKLYLIVFF